MKHFIQVMFVLAFSFVFLSCTRQEAFDPVQVRKSIDEANARYSEAIRQNNVAAALEEYTLDATVVPPNGEILKGQEAIGELYTKFFQMGMNDIKMITLEVGGTGDMAYEIGKTKVWIQPQGQEAFVDSSRYLVIWKRQTDATWKVHVDIWNTSTPMPGQ